MRVLVSGGAGYIGSHTCVELLEAGYQLMVIDNLSNSKEEALRRVAHITGREPAFLCADLRDQTALQTLFGIMTSMPLFTLLDSRQWGSPRRSR